MFLGATACIILTFVCGHCRLPYCIDTCSLHKSTVHASSAWSAIAPSRLCTAGPPQAAVHALARRFHRGRPYLVLGLAPCGLRERQLHLPGQCRGLEARRTRNVAGLVRCAHDPHRVGLRRRRGAADSAAWLEYAECYLGPQALCELARLRVRAWLPVCTRLLHGLGRRHRRAPHRRVALGGRVLALAVAVRVRFVEAGVRAERARVLSVATCTCAVGGGAGTAGKAAAVDAGDAPMLSRKRRASSRSDVAE
jgi:hypothetical protein